jgi:hypothetical protein
LRPITASNIPCGYRPVNNRATAAIRTRIPIRPPPICQLRIRGHGKKPKDRVRVPERLDDLGGQALPPERSRVPRAKARRCLPPDLVDRPWRCVVLNDVTHQWSEQGGHRRSHSHEYQCNTDQSALEGSRLIVFDIWSGMSRSDEATARVLGPHRCNLTESPERFESLRVPLKSGASKLSLVRRAVRRGQGPFGGLEWTIGHVRAPRC